MPIHYSHLRSGNLNGIYRDFAEILGMEITLRIYQYYKGLQVTFPTRLLDKAYVEEQIKKEYNGTNAKDLARKYEYSERWVRKNSESNKGRREGLQKMILKWAIGGAIVGAIIALITQDSVAALALVGAAVGVIFRKWVLRTFWS